MSYSVELWNEYNKVKNNLSCHIRGLKDFLYMFNEKYKSEDSLKYCLKVVYDLPYKVTNYPSLLEGINCFKQDMMNQRNYLDDYLSGIKDEIIKPLSMIYDKLTKRLNNNIKEMENNDKIYRILINKLDISKNNFHSSAKDAELFQLKCEMSKNLQDYSIENKRIDEIRAQNALKRAKECETNYITSLNDINKYQDEYIETKKKILNEIQELEEEIGESMKDSLRKYIIYQVSYLRNMQYDIDKKAKIMENINVRNDILDYIYNNSTNAIPPYKFEYVPYKSDIDQRLINSSNDQKLSKDILNEVKNFMGQTFCFDKENNDKLLGKNKINQEIAEIVKASYSDKNLSNEQIKSIKKFLTNKYTRRLLLKELNSIRIQGNYSLNEVSYNTIGDLLKESLNSITSCKDYDSVKLIITLSNSLYKLESNKPRIFLQEYIKQHQMWGRYDFWRDIIKYSIIEEMHIRKGFNSYTNENNELKKVRLKEIAKSQLNSYLYSMISFGINPNLMFQIIEDFTIYYNLQKSSNEDLLKIVNEYKNQMDGENKNKISNDKKDEQLNNLTESKINKNDLIHERVKEDNDNLKEEITEDDKKTDVENSNEINDIEKNSKETNNQESNKETKINLDKNINNEICNSDNNNNKDNQNIKNLNKIDMNDLGIIESMDNNIIINSNKEKDEDKKNEEGNN